MRRLLPLVAAVLAAALPAVAPAQESVAAPTGLVVTGSLAGGGELGLSHGKAGVVEAEVVAGYEFRDVGLRPEVGFVVGFEPDANVAFRLGVSWRVPQTPFQLRAAFDASNARDQSMCWRWLLLGIGAEIRLTGAFGLFAEVDSGAPLNANAGVPLLVRGGPSFRF